MYANAPGSSSERAAASIPETTAKAARTTEATRTARTAGGEEQEPVADPQRPPTAARNLVLTAGDGQITATWAAPHDIGEPGDWLGYTIEIRGPHEDEWFEWGFYETSTATIDYLDNGTTYEIRVIAFNLWGETPTQPNTATPQAP